MFCCDPCCGRSGICLGVRCIGGGGQRGSSLSSEFTLLTLPCFRWPLGPSWLAQRPAGSETRGQCVVPFLLLTTSLEHGPDSLGGGRGSSGFSREVEWVVDRLLWGWRLRGPGPWGRPAVWAPRDLCDSRPEVVCYLGESPCRQAVSWLHEAHRTVEGGPPSSRSAVLHVDLAGSPSQNRAGAHVGAVADTSQGPSWVGACRRELCSCGPWARAGASWRPDCCARLADPADPRFYIFNFFLS